MTQQQENISLSKAILRKALKDSNHSAKAANLIYVTDKHLTIERSRNGKDFAYYEDKGKVKDEIVLERIKKLVLPPAWTNVRICRLENGHLQAVGFDALNRKQYKYHHLWSSIRNHTKFYRLLEFGKKLPAIRKKVNEDLSLVGYPKEKILAAIITLLELTNIRVGNASYEKLYGSFGLTTLKNRHVTLNGPELNFSFVGKKGIKHRISLRSKRLARIVKACKDIPGKELFEYEDENGIVHNIDSGMVNEYIKNIAGADFTAKDIRTWTGSVLALSAFKEAGDFESDAEMKRKVNESFESIAKQLGNTKAVCKKYYVHPVILKLYEEKNLGKYISNLEDVELDDKVSSLTPNEKKFMKILEEKG